MNYTPAQQAAIDAEGNVLVLAGAGTGKTRTMVARCLDRLFRVPNPTDLDRVLMVTFTEAAAAEMRERIGLALHQRLVEHPDERRVEEQIALLDTSKIGTLHSLAFDLIREHAHTLSLGSGVRILSPEESFRLAENALNDVFEAHFASDLEASQTLCRQIRQAGNGDDSPIRNLVLQLHRFAQSLADPTTWLETQAKRYGAEHPELWIDWFLRSIPQWAAEQQARLAPFITDCPNLEQCHRLLGEMAAKTETISEGSTLSSDERLLRTQAITNLLHQAIATDHEWARGHITKFRKPTESVFKHLAFLTSLFNNVEDDISVPLQEDWDRARHWILTLLQLTEEFDTRYRELKTQWEGLDFQDLEQLTLELLYPHHENAETEFAERIRTRFDYVFVDEYQDINGAQDAIIKALCGRGDQANLFIVGDIKQSIYRFRRANPNILSAYERRGFEPDGETKTIYLQSNYRSHYDILNFANRFFTDLATQIPGFDYGEQAKLSVGLGPGLEEAADRENEIPRVEFHIVDKETIKQTGISSLEAQAHVIAQRILEFVRSHRSNESSAKENEPQSFNWSDIAILLRSVSSRSQTIARVLSQYRIPVQASTGEFFELPEIADLIALLNVIDNPLQDIPLLTLLRSPFFGFTPNDLALIRMAEPQGYFWQALEKFPSSEAELRQQWLTSKTLDESQTTTLFEECLAKVHHVREKHREWTQGRRTLSIADQLEVILSEGFYPEYIASLFPAREPRAQIGHLLQMIREYEQQPDASLPHFLRWIDQLKDSEHVIEPLAESTSNAVQLMSIHKSKGLEFPLVFLPDLDKRFNTSDLHSPLIIDEALGLCPIINLPNTAESYPSLPHWLAQREHQTQLVDEEARLLYVAATRAEDHLILMGTASEKVREESWTDTSNDPARNKSTSFLDWIGPWMSRESTHLTGLQTILHDKLTLPPRTQDTEEGLPEESAPDSPEPLTSDEAKSVNQRMEWVYPHFEATRQRAKASASNLDRQPSISGPQSEAPEEPSRLAFHGKELGIAYHRALQLIAPVDGARIPTANRALRELVARGFLTEQDLQQLTPDRIVAFWTSEAGSALRARADKLHRELPFTARFSAAELDSLGFIAHLSPEMNTDFITIQGVIDLAMIDEEEIWLLDFKSERVSPGSTATQIAEHTPQLGLYRLALEKIYRRQVTHCWLHFLATDTTHDLLTSL